MFPCGNNLISKYKSKWYHWQRCWRIPRIECEINGKKQIKKTDGKKAGRTCYDLPIYFGYHLLQHLYVCLLMLQPNPKAIREFMVDELIQHHTLHYNVERWERDIL